MRERESERERERENRGLHVGALEAGARDDDVLEVHVNLASVRKVVVGLLPRLLHEEVCSGSGGRGELE